MLDILQTIFALLLTLAILVTVHEWGHYWVAKRAGVKILKFSIGFGAPIYQWQRGETTFVIGWIPLGGYVKMLGEGQGDIISAADKPRAFDQQSLKVRAAIVAAGPLINLILAVVLYTAMYMYGTHGAKALIGEVTANSPAAIAGFQSGDQILTINDQASIHWQTAIQAMLINVVDDQALHFKVKNGVDPARNLIMPATVLVADDFSQANLLEKLGFSPLKPSAKIGTVVENQPAALAGIQTGDVIINIDDQAIKNWYDLADIIANSEKSPLHLKIQRADQVLSMTVTPKGELGQKRIGIGAAWQVTDFYSIEQAGFIQALQQGATQTWSMIRLSLQMFGKMLSAEISAKNISGPITIADYAGKSFAMGLSQYLGFLALLSVSLGVLNLLPIPLLDGGHLLIYLLEWVKGSPLPDQAIDIMQKIGLSLILLLMSLALFNDFSRLFGD